MNKHLPNSTKNRRGDADFTPLRVAARRREKYYTKQFSKVGKSVLSTISQRGFHFDSPNLQDSFYMALYRMVLQMSHIGENFRVC